jgi:Cdc6-like AAA superfamily ATPase
MPNDIDADAITKSIRRSFIRFPHIQEVFDRLNALYQYSGNGEEAEHILLLGEAGVGKSTLLRKFRQLHLPIEHNEYTEIPVLYAQVDPGCSIKKLASSMLLALGSEFWNKGSEAELTYQLTCLLQACKVRLVILDEVNHLVDRGGEKTHHTIADWIKRLADSVALPFVLAGIPRSERLLDTNDQLRSRFREVLSVQPFSIEDIAAEGKFGAVLQSFAKLLVGLPSIELTSQKMIRAFAFATGGRLRELRKLLVRAVEIACQEPTPRLTRGVLALAFEKVIYRNAGSNRNPFKTGFKEVPLTAAGEPFAPVER